jgi:hypothetical protein
MKTRDVRTLAILATVGALLALSGCGEDDVTNIYPPAAELYTITGRVLSYPSSQVVPGAAIVLASGQRTGVCDADGQFEIAGVEAGSHLLTISAAGHADSRATIQLGDADHDGVKNRHAHFDLYVVETTASVAVTVYGAPSGEVLAGVSVAVVDVDLFPGSLSRVDMSSYAATAVTDADGVAHLTGLPAATVMIAAMPYDADADGITDYVTQTAEFELGPGETVSRAMVMEPGSGGVEVVATNLPGYSDLVSAPAIWFVFSGPMNTDPEATRVSLTRSDYPYPEVAVAANWTSPVRLEITPLEILPAESVTLEMSVQPVYGGGFELSRYFHWTTGGVTPPGDCEGVVTDLRLALGHAPLDFDTRVVNLVWSAVAGSGGYAIYARDDRGNPGWTWLLNEPTDFDTGEVSVGVSLPAAFDRYGADGVQTPFAGTAITFCVVPQRAVDPEPGPPHGVLTLGDTTPPALTAMTQSGSGVNFTPTSQLFAIDVDFSEFLHADVAAPTIAVVEAGGDPAFTLDPADAIWSWEQGRHGGRFTFILAPGDDASGDQVRVTMTDIRDLSGNLVEGNVASDWLTIEPWSNVFDFELSAQGWTDVGQGWEWGHPTIGPQSAHGGTNCWGTNLQSGYGMNWDTSVTSPPILIQPGATDLRFWRWTDLYYDDVVTLFVIQEDNTATQLATFYYDTSGWEAAQFDLAGYAGQRIRIRFRFESDGSSYNDGEGFFLDDVLIGVE